MSARSGSSLILAIAARALRRSRGAQRGRPGRARRGGRWRRGRRPLAAREACSSADREPDRPRPRRPSVSPRSRPRPGRARPRARGGAPRGRQSGTRRRGRRARSGGAAPSPGRPVDRRLLRLVPALDRSRNCDRALLAGATPAYVLPHGVEYDREEGDHDDRGKRLRGVPERVDHEEAEHDQRHADSDHDRHASRLFPTQPVAGGSDEDEDHERAGAADGCDRRQIDRVRDDEHDRGADQDAAFRADPRSGPKNGGTGRRRPALPSARPMRTTSRRRTRPCRPWQRWRSS